MTQDTIITGDCIELMRELPECCIDLTVTSPPYDSLRQYEGYTFDFEGIAKQLFRITKDGGVVVWIVGDATVNGSETGTSFKQALYFKDIGFNLYDTMIYGRSTVPQTQRRYEPEFEYMFVFSKGSPKTFNPIMEKKRWIDNRRDKVYHRIGGDTQFKIGISSQKTTKIAGNIWYYAVGGWHVTHDKIAHQHPAIFPEELARDHIISWSNEGDLVFDPMCGSGTTCKMAYMLGRHYLGFDVSESYVNIAKERMILAEKELEEEKRQLIMF